MKTFKVAQKRRDVGPTEPLPDPTMSIPYTEFTIEAEPVADGIAMLLNDMYRDTGRKAKWLLLGWETWLQLGWELGDRRELIRPEEFMGIPIVVDEHSRRCIVPLPSLRNVRFGGGR